jgi:hypothetical protein
MAIPGLREARWPPDLCGSEPRCSRYTRFGDLGAKVPGTAMDASNYHAPNEIAVTDHRVAWRPPDLCGSKPRFSSYTHIVDRGAKVPRTE